MNGKKNTNHWVNLNSNPLEGLLEAQNPVVEYTFPNFLHSQEGKK